jgi:hypothetical protein
VECKNKRDTNIGNWNHLKIIKKIPEQHTRKVRKQELQKTAILRAAHLLKEALTLKYKTFVVGNIITCTINCNHRAVATVYTLQTWFVAGIILVINNNNNNNNR